MSIIQSVNEVMATHTRLRHAEAGNERTGGCAELEAELVEAHRRAVGHGLAAADEDSECAEGRRCGVAARAVPVLAVQSKQQLREKEVRRKCVRDREGIDELEQQERPADDVCRSDVYLCGTVEHRGQMDLRQVCHVVRRNEVEVASRAVRVQVSGLGAHGS